MDVVAHHVVTGADHFEIVDGDILTVTILKLDDVPGWYRAVMLLPQVPMFQDILSLRYADHDISILGKPRVPVIFGIVWQVARLEHCWLSLFVHFGAHFDSFVGRYVTFRESVSFAYLSQSVSLFLQLHGSKCFRLVQSELVSHSEY